MTPVAPTVGDHRQMESVSPAAAWVDAVVGRLQNGTPTCAVVVGAPGSGRTALLRAVVERAAGLDIPIVIGPPTLPLAADSLSIAVADDLHRWPAQLLDAVVAEVAAGRMSLVGATEARSHDLALRRATEVADRSALALTMPIMGTAEVLTRAGRLGLTLTPSTASQLRRRCGGARGIVDAALRALRDSEPNPAGGEGDPLTVATRIARDAHHRLLLRLDDATVAVLVLASVRAPLDPDSVAETLGIDRATALVGLDRARGTGLLGGSDVFASAAREPLREVVGDARIADLRRRAISARLRAPELSADDALGAVGAGIDDPRLVDVLLAEAESIAVTAPTRAATMLSAADRAAPGRADVR
ncbi:hypothetical protein GS4_53_00030, partial [Gordonia soli NBRC 108243]